MSQNGSVLDLIQGLAVHRIGLAVALAALPVVTFLLGRLLMRFSARASARFLTIPVHVTVLPGVGMAMIVAYLLFFARENLLSGYDAVLFFGPIVSMVLTLVAARRIMPFERLPGFDRLSGLMILAGVSFAATYVLYQLAFRVWFVASIETLGALFVGLFILFRLGARRLLGRASGADPDSRAR